MRPCWVILATIITLPFQNKLWLSLIVCFLNFWWYYCCLFLASYVFVIQFMSTISNCANLLSIHTCTLSINFILLKKVSQELSDFPHLTGWSSAVVWGVSFHLGDSLSIFCMGFPFSWIQCLLSFLLCFGRILRLWMSEILSILTLILNSWE